MRLRNRSQAAMPATHWTGRPVRQARARPTWNQSAFGSWDPPWQGGEKVIGQGPGCCQDRDGKLPSTRVLVPGHTKQSIDSTDGTSYPVSGAENINH